MCMTKIYDEHDIFYDLSYVQNSLATVLTKKNIYKNLKNTPTTLKNYNTIGVYCNVLNITVRYKNYLEVIRLAISFSNVSYIGNN